MKLQALQDCLFVQPDIEKHALIALLKEKKTGTGTVIAVGPKATECKVGDKIFFGDFVGQDISFEGEHYLVMREAHIMGVFEND